MSDSQQLHRKIPSSENGGSRTGKRQLLAAHGALVATPKFGSENVVTTASDDARIDVMEELVPLIVDSLGNEGREVEALTTDQLDVAALVDRVLTQVADLTDVPAEIEAAAKLLQVVHSAKQGMARDVVAKLRDAVTRVVEPAMTEVHESIRLLAASPPGRLRTIGHETLTILARVKPTADDAAATVKDAARRIERAGEIEARINHFAPVDEQPIHGAINEQARAAARQAFQALLREMVLNHLRLKWPTLTDAAESLLLLGSELRGRLDEISEASEAWIREQRDVLPPCNTVLRLSGTNNNEAIAGVLERHRFAGRKDLIRHVIDRTFAKLRERLMERGQQDLAALPESHLLAAVSAQETFGAIREIIASEVEPEVQSVYGRLKQFGLKRAFETMIQHSRLTSDVGPRGSTRFNLNVYRIVILSLPKVARAEDTDVASWIRNAFDVKSVIITEHPAAFDEVVVHRIAGGWPWQLLPSNNHLRDQYVASAAAGHRPHLVKVLPESPRGEIVPVYRNQTERTQHE